jgi:hypothetical protein
MHDNWNFQQASQTIAIACADTIVDQSGLFLLWQSLKWQRIAICKCKKCFNILSGKLLSFLFQTSEKNKMAKKISHFQMNILCHFNICHNGKRPLRLSCAMKCSV